MENSQELDEIKMKLDIIIQELKSKKIDILNDWITEVDAKKIFNRGTTWWWDKRVSGELTYSKLNNTVYYKREDLINLLEKNKVEAFKQ